MDKFLAKIDEYTEKLTSMKVLDLLNKLLAYIGDALTNVLGEEEAGKIVTALYKFGD